MTTTLLQTPLFSWHDAHGGSLVDFAGWSMPVKYTSIVDEHQATRERVTLFDVSHMGRLLVHGRDAALFLERMVTRRVKDMQPGRIRYSLVTDQSGGVLDDILVYCIDSEGSDLTFQLVVNASNREKIKSWLDLHVEKQQVSIVDLTFETSMIAVQGPRALLTAQAIISEPLESLGYYRSLVTNLGGTEATVSRTGYTGEDGIELIVAADKALETWERLLKAGQPYEVIPAGLAARDTLRLEAGMPLYGHELDEQIDPIEAGLKFAVDLEEREFPGSQVLVECSAGGASRKRVGLRLFGRRIPREGYPILDTSEIVGIVTSGTFSPTFECPIAMGFVPHGLAEPGTALSIDIRGKLENAEVTALPFYKRSKT